MRIACQVIAMAVGLVLFSTLTARAESTAEAYARGNELLVKGSFQESLRAYSVAARGDRTNRQYAQQFMLVRRVIALRSRLDSEKDSKRWLEIAQSLRSFYVDRKLHSEALVVDEKIHAKLGTAMSAGQLAETQLAMGKNAEATRVLTALTPEKATKYSQAVLAISLARQGRLAEARKAGQGIAGSASSDPGTLYVQSRMQAAIGNPDAALKLLTRCMEMVPPSRQDALKAHAKKARDFADLASTDAFGAVLETKSKVAESKCSGGSSCAGCPSRGKCPGSQGK